MKPKLSSVSIFVSTVSVLLLLHAGVANAENPRNQATSRALTSAVGALFGNDGQVPAEAKRMVDSVLQQSGTNEAMARLVENPACETGAELSGGYRQKGWIALPSVQMGKEGEKGVAGFTVQPPKPLENLASYKVKFNAEDEKPSISATFSIGELPGSHETGVSIQHVISVKLQYRDKYDYLNALGIDARNLPGARTILELMDRKSGEIAAAPQSGSAVKAALTALKNELVPQIFQSAAKFEKATIGEGASMTVESSWDTGKVPLGKGVKGDTDLSLKRTITVMQEERLEPGQKPGQGVKFHETSVSVGLGGGLGTEAFDLKGEAAVSVSYSTDPEKQNETVSAERRKLAAEIREGRLDDAGALALKQLAPVVRAGEISKAMELVREQLAAEFPKGVKIRFDEGMLASLLEAGTLEESRERLTGLADVLSRTADGRERERLVGAYVRDLRAGFQARQPRENLDQVVLISLKSLVAAAEPYAARWDELPAEIRTPGGISRIVGYVIDQPHGNILLLGKAVPGAPLLTIDDLVIGARAVWKDGATPTCSLDPDPGNLDGPQHSRVTGVPNDSGFARIMLDADYLMKRIMLGLVPVNEPGFRSYADYLRENALRGKAEESMNRFWFYPCPLRTGDIEMSKDGSVVLFDTGVQVLSEQMVLAREGLLGTGRLNSTADEAAAGFTRLLPALERDFPEFRHLHGLFDIVLLAKTWQRLMPDPALIDRLAALPYRKTDVPADYTGLKVAVYHDQQKSGTYYLMGGVNVQLSAGPRSWLVTDDHGPEALRTASAGLGNSSVIAGRADAAGLALPAGAAARRSDGNTDMASVFSFIRRGKNAEADALLRKLIQADPYDPMPWAARACLDFQVRDYAAALVDAGHSENLDPDNPDTVLLSSVVRFEAHNLTGRADEALADIDFALSRLPDNARSHILRGDALSALDRATEARSEYRKAIDIDPRSVMAHVGLGLVEISQGWVVKGKKLIEKARMLCGTEPDVPAVKAALAVAELSTSVLGDAEERMAASRTYAEAVLSDSASDPESRIRALITLSGIAMIREDWSVVDRYLDQALQIAPASPIPPLMLAELAQEAKRDDLARRYLAKADKIAPDYPAVKALHRRLETSP